MKAIFDNPITTCRELWIDEKIVAYVTKTGCQRFSNINDAGELEDGSAICFDGWGKFEDGKIVGNINAINYYNRPKNA